METYFETWMEWRDNETSVSKKTIKENRFMWNSLLKGSGYHFDSLKGGDCKKFDLNIY
jgi:hypothetical protein